MSLPRTILAAMIAASFATGAATIAAAQDLREMPIGVGPEDELAARVGIAL